MADTFESRFTLTDDPLELLRRMQAEGTLDLDAVEPELRARFLAQQAAERQPSANGKKRAARPQSSKGMQDAASPVPPSRSSNPATQESPSANGKNHNPDAPPTTPSAAGRDPRGKFALGNCGGPGNPFARQVAALRQAALNRFDGEKIGKIFDMLYELALEGDVRAARLILSYTLGKAAPFQHPDGADADEWNRFKENGPMLGETDHVHAVDPIVPLTICRNVRDFATVRQYGIWDGFLRQTPEERKKNDRQADRGDVAVLEKWLAKSPLGVPDPSTITVANKPKPSANGKKRP